MRVHLPQEGWLSAWRTRLARTRPRLPVTIHPGRVVLTLALSSMLYVFAVSQTSAEATWLTTFSVPVDAVNVPSGLGTVDHLAPVHLRVRAAQEVLSRLQPDSFTAQVDARHAHDGDTELPVVVRSTDPGVNAVASEPAQMQLHLEAIQQRVLPVHVHIVGQVAEGYQPGPKPDHVTLAGPASLVDQAVEAVVDVGVGGATVSVNGVFTSSVVDANGNSLTAATQHITPAAVSVEVPITQLTQYKEVGVRPVTRGEPPPGYLVQPLELNPATATLVGSAAALAGTTFVETQPIDIGGIATTVVRRVALVAPTGTLLLQPDQTVNVTVRVRPLVMTQTLRVSPSVVNLPNDVTLTRPPDAVAVTIAGPAPTLSTLGAVDLRVVLDVAGKGPGQYQITPDVQNLPAGMTLESVGPHQVLVDLSAAAAGAA